MGVDLDEFSDNIYCTFCDSLQA